VISFQSYNVKIVENKYKKQKMEKILGIDLGTNSIGWAIRDTSETENQIIDKGVLTFDKGVAEDKSGEHPTVQKRTDARGIRRNYQAEKYRKWSLLECLIENNMCPLSIDELNDWRHYKKGVGRKYPMTEKFIQWLRFDFDGDGKPDFERLGFSKHESYYLFRCLIIDETKKEIFKTEPQIIGRVLYQMVQRRGYNDGSEIDENEKNELSKTIMKGGGDAGALGANEIEPYISKYKTLGAALYQIQKETKSRIRKRYNLRSRFEAEIKEICSIQGLEHLYKKIWTSIIWQRPLRSQKGLVGICTFENNKSRCPISHPFYEEYRTWVFINNLKIKPINESTNNMDLKEILHSIVYPEFFKAAPDFKLSTIKNKLKKAGYEIGAKFPDDTKVLSMSFNYKMKEIFGEAWKEKLGWNEIIINVQKDNICKYNVEDLWHLHFVKTTNKNTGETPFDFLKRFSIEKLNIKESAESFAKIRLQQGYATLSINAIKKILPYLQKGFIYSEAVYLANLPEVLSTKNVTEDTAIHFAEEVRRILKENYKEKKYLQVVNELINDQLNAAQRYGMGANYQLDQDDYNDINKKIEDVFGKTSWQNIEEEEKSIATGFVSNKYLAFLQKRIFSKNVFEKNERLHDKIFKWISDTYNIPAERIKHLWHPSEQETYAKAPEKDGKKYLGSPEPISKGFKNPMALKTLHKLKKLINYLLEINKIDEDTRIVIEIARELNDANKRKAIERWQRDREAENDKYKKQIIEINKECNTQLDAEDKNLIDKIRLWEEQNRLCIYTGKTIGLCDVLNGSKYDYEHTIPASLSFDNEMKNLTVADKTYNQQIKGKKLPAECPNYETEYTHNGITYKPILDTVQSIFGRLVEEEIKTKYGKKTVLKFEKIIALEKTYQEWKDKKSDDKETKNNIIIKKHYLKMELDYWRYKLLTFTTKEYKAGWRNSQLRDTQTITKYSLPYLKTIFKKVEVQKGNITADFRKIYKVQPRLEKKDRTKHSHHAIDAAVLTLIPPPAVRDKILFKYNEAKDNNTGYHETPMQWNSFNTNHILNIEEEILINYLPEHRTLTTTEKVVRKRGKIQFVKEKSEGNKWQYKLDDQGKKIPLIAKGDSIRGQLHKLSNFGAINNGEAIILVERYPISSFTSITDCKHIVDAKVKELVQTELQRRMDNGLSFDKAKLEPVHFHKGNEVIKKVRCKVAAGRGYLTTEKAIKIGSHNYKSKHEYKESVYVQNEENTYCLYYEKKVEDKINRAFRIIGLFELSQLNLKNENEIKLENYYNKIISGKGKNALELPLVQIPKVGTKCIFYKESIDELKELDNPDLLKRLFRVYKFNVIGVTNYIYLQNHLEARKNDELGNGDGIFDRNLYQSRLMLNPDKFTCAIEGKHFEIKLDGEIKWLL
jgi:CRISPR-associated endonuclease Csn1